MPVFLVTNDDGVASPMLPPLIAALSDLGTVRVSVPLGEQSWKGKAMTRFGRVQAERVSNLGVEAFAVEGTPADCVNLGVHSLFGGPPDWVVSGINIGANVGLSFILNSGTVGGALEGALAGLPAVALSVRVAREIYEQWVREAKITGEEGERCIAESARASGRIMGIAASQGLPPGAMLLNVNFPSTICAETPVRWSHLQENRTGPLFQQDGEGFHHRYQGGGWQSDAPGNDWDLVESGVTSITPLSFSGLTTAPPNPDPFA